MILWGINGIITDEPAIGRNLLEVRSKLSPIERLLLHAAVIHNRPIPTPPDINHAKANNTTLVFDSNPAFFVQQR